MTEDINLKAVGVVALSAIIGGYFIIFEKQILEGAIIAGAGIIMNFLEFLKWIKLIPSTLQSFGGKDHKLYQTDPDKSPLVKTGDNSPVTITYGNAEKSKVIDLNSINKLIMDSDEVDWKYDDEEGIFTYIKDVGLEIKEDRTRDYGNYEEPWLNKFADEKGYRIIYNIYYKNSYIDKVYIVGVDGYRGFIPVPSDGYTSNPKITKWQYILGKIIHSNPSHNPYSKDEPYTFDNTLKRANITVA